jgi:tight adherence protein C
MPTELLYEYGIPALIFLAVGSGIFSLVYRTMADRTKRNQRGTSGIFTNGTVILDDIEDSSTSSSDLTPVLAAQIPNSETDRRELEKELRTAGYFGRRALLEYAAVRAVLVLTPLIGAGILALGVDDDQMWKVIAGGLLLAMLGYSLPRVYLYYRGRERMRKLENALPVAVDMLTLCITAGQTLTASLGRVAKELAPAHPLMSAELAITKRHAEISNLPHALKQLAHRVPIGETRNLALILAQAERLGSETGPALLEYANNIRTGMKQRADTRANQAMFWMLFPTLLCLWIPAAILLVGPAILEFRSERQKIFQQWRQSRDQLKTVNQANPVQKKPETKNSESTQQTNIIPVARE